MNLYVIFVRQSTDSWDAPWVVSAWDQSSIEENEKGYKEELEKFYEQYGPDNVRVGITKFDEDKVKEMFNPQSISLD